MQAIYYGIYEDLRDRIIAGETPYQSYLPSERQLIERYQCSQNTLRKAQAVLRIHGFTQPVQGKGIKVIWQPSRRANFVLGEIETFKEAAARNGLCVRTEVPVLETVKADEDLAARSGFECGAELVHVERIRFLDEVPVIYDASYFLAWLVPGLTREIAADSAYAYLENDLGITISTSKRTVTMEYASPRDRQALELLDFDMVAVVTGHTFDSKGIMFEYTTSRHRPDYFTFHDTAVRGY